MSHCPICKFRLVEDLFGCYCPNKDCCFISEIPNIANEKDIIPLLYESGKLIKWIEVDYDTKFWFFNGKLHREDGPAVEYFDGNKCCYLNN